MGARAGAGAGVISIIIAAVGAAVGAAVVAVAAVVAIAGIFRNRYFGPTGCAVAAAEDGPHGAQAAVGPVLAQEHRGDARPLGLPQLAELEGVCQCAGGARAPAR